MRALIARTPKTIIAAALGAAVIFTTPVSAMAQDEVNEQRIRKIESEVRALQRKVFPGGSGRFFEPQITADQPEQPIIVDRNSIPQSTPLTSVLTRLDALEVQVQQLTAMSEQNANSLRLLEERLGIVEQSQAAAASEPEQSVETAAVAQEEKPEFAPLEEPNAPAVTAERIAAVQAIAKPQTDDPADDEYSYGFRLWNAGFYPEARQQLSNFLEGYPDHWRVTWARNLLGRAYLDDNMPDEASRWFLRNFQEDKQGERAPDSLLYLAQAMIADNDTRRACIALSEFAKNYTAVAVGRLSDEYQSTRRRVTCN